MRRVRFWVRDEGLGIPAGEEQRIFEKFYRLDPQMSRGVGGTGLGLYICNELVTRMGGRIWVEANGKKGSMFFFELPAAGAGVTGAANVGADRSSDARTSSSQRAALRTPELTAPTAVG